ncbi:MAG: DUF3179 domain-containing protein [Gemmatimonadetes bacterium]|uniref:DUF3179 domain-containing protein n=1 Tax=Candidatus Kutchimonas denitrificans TaxID=3056748 RepID=A0AAE4ZBB4_9BACT|nr:DUF3179 domain-containing protein [Gemmatimonadota bacterium]NIR76573.1 DUF3179 domain-containing protein [Candidatus Kutchimonas denitrificans]NIS01129.1 DUF3179 domain-containing protein [Gemmatimonadota bacterium]NIT66896.1 DUF3179 domain-containing protein [Gemmatimonadota bacterium]NIU54669.1 DUF3179 domain-containing protein [Gemmatimonadota bacterium]
MIDGQTHHFLYRGLYDGVSFLMDRETGSYWNHITGRAMHGPLEGAKLPVANLLHMSVEQARAAYPDLRVAISDRPIRGEQSPFWPVAKQVPVLPDRFLSTMAGEDTRRPTMDVGLGVWSDGAARFYPLEHVAESNDMAFDKLDGRGLLVYFDPAGHALAAIYTEARDASWDGKTLGLSDGTSIRQGVLYGPDGERRPMDRPLQLFTRWYGFALTFPETEVYEP